jgi:hypothetical protein
VLVLFGGWSTPGNGSVGDTWELGAGGWTRAPGPGPGNRCDPGMQFDALRGRIVLFGGLTSFSGAVPNVANDCWEYTGAAGGWVQRSPIGAPSARAYAEMVWDAPRARLVAHGGMDAGGARGETYALSRTAPAAAVPFGLACAATSGLPAIDAPPFALPWLGGTFSVRVSSSAPAATQALLWIGASRTTWGGVNLPLALDFMGLTGCQLHAALDAPLLLGLTGGEGLATGSVCGNCPSFVGRRLYFQALILDPSAPRAFPGATTNGLELTIGGG